MVHVALILAQLLAASLAIIGKLVLREVPATVLVVARAAGAALVLGMVQLIRGLPWPARPAYGRLALLGLLGVSANQGFFLLGLERTAAINASIMVTTIPVFTVAIAMLMGRERPSSLKMAGIGLAAAGAIYMIGPDRIREAPTAALGNLFLVTGMAGYGLYLVLARSLLRQLPPVTVSLFVMTFGALGALVPAASAWSGFTPESVSGHTWWLVGYVIAGPTLTTYFLNIWALGRASSSMVAAYVYLQPICTGLVAPLVLVGEGLSTRAAVAGGLIFLGLGAVIAGEAREVTAAAGPVVGE